MYHSIQAEVRKLKSTPIIYLMVFCWLFISGVAFLANTLDVHNRVELNVNPWDRFFIGSMAIFSLFILSPVITLLTSAFLQIEQKANSWKYMYATPTRRISVYFSKLLTILVVISITTLMLLVFIVLAGYLVDAFYPEYEFTYYNPSFDYLFRTAFRTVLSCLGIIGFQYFLSILSKNFLLPMGVGILGFIAAFIFTSTNSKVTLYFLYAYPMVTQDFGSFPSDHRQVVFGEWLTNMEVYSVGFFVVFVLLGCIYERRRNVS
ncbi:MAG: ABC transporter permease [Bacteroidota bacterium]